MPSSFLVGCIDSFALIHSNISIQVAGLRTTGVAMPGETFFVERGTQFCIYSFCNLTAAMVLLFEMY
jgi:hypothetical protein